MTGFYIMSSEKMIVDCAPCASQTPEEIRNNADLIVNSLNNIVNDFKDMQRKANEYDEMKQLLDFAYGIIIGAIKKDQEILNSIKKIIV